MRYTHPGIYVSVAIIFATFGYEIGRWAGLW